MKKIKIIIVLVAITLLITSCGSYRNSLCPAYPPNVYKKEVSK